MTDPKQDWADEIAKRIVCDQWMDSPKHREDALMELFAQALRDEREACARVVEADLSPELGKEVADLIRARTDQEQG